MHHIYVTVTDPTLELVILAQALLRDQEDQLKYPLKLKDISHYFKEGVLSIHYTTQAPADELPIDLIKGRLNTILESKRYMIMSLYALDITPENALLEDNSSN